MKRSRVSDQRDQGLPFVPDEGSIRCGIEVCRLNRMRHHRYVIATGSEFMPFFSLSFFTFALVCGFCWIISNIDQQNPRNPILVASTSKAWNNSDAGALKTKVVNNWASEALAHPLFQPDGSAAQNEKDSQESVAAIWPPILPRLTGIMISPGGIGCTFLHKDGSTFMATVGDYFGPYKVVEINVNDVTISGPGGRQILSLNFDRKSDHRPTASSFLLAANDVGLRTWPDRIAGLPQTTVAPRP